MCVHLLLCSVNGFLVCLCLCGENYRENGDKIPADIKGEVESNMNLLKEAVKSQNIADIDRYSDALSKAFEKMYQAGQQAGAQQGGPQGPFQGGPQPGPQPEGPDEQ
ncbi:MAG: hypothetical protein J5835_05615 [Bacteroidales bacterium]|nr:hypothetical protein [Bacteroidales bacterium]